MKVLLFKFFYRSASVSTTGNQKKQNLSTGRSHLRPQKTNENNTKNREEPDKRHFRTGTTNVTGKTKTLGQAL